MRFSGWVHCFKRKLSRRPLAWSHRPQLECLELRLAPATHTWDGEVSNLWSNPGNWAEGVAPSSAEQNVVLVFPGGFANPTNTNDIPNLIVQSLSITGPIVQSYVLGGPNPITLTGPITDSSTITGGSPGPNVIGFAITLPTTQTITVASAAGPGLQITGAITGNGGLTKAGAGLLELLGANAYTGTTTVSQGTLDGNIPGALIIGDNVSAPNSAIVMGPTLSPTAPITVNASGTLNLGLASYTIGPLSMVGGTVTIAGAGREFGTLVLNGDVTATADPAGNPATISGNGNLSLGGATRTFTVTGSPSTPGMVISTVITDGVGIVSSLVEAGTGMLTLSGANTYTGGTTLSSGTLTVGNNSALGTGMLALNGGTLQFTMFITLSNAYTVGGPATIGGSNAVELDGAGVLTAGNTLTVTNTAIQTDFFGTLSGPGGLTVAAGSDQVILDNVAKTYTGPTLINSGLLLVGFTNYLPSTTAVTVAAGGILSLNGFSDQIGSLAGNGAVHFQESLGQGPAPTLTTNGDNTSTTFSGVISGMGTLVKIGTGTLTLSGANTFSGATTVSTGTLLVNGSLPTSVTVSSGATLGGSGTVGPITAAGTVSPGNPGTAVLQSGADTFNAGSFFVVTLNGTTAGNGYDQLNATGAVNLSGSPTLTVTAGFAASPGNSFVIITSTGGITGTFSGLANNALLNINGQVFQINYSANLVVLSRTAIATMTTVASSANPSIFGQAITFTATVTPNNPSFGSPTGTVQFQIDFANFGSPVALTNGVATSSPSSNLPVGNHTIAAIYSGDSNFFTSTGSSLPQTVNLASTTVVVSSSINPSVFGQSVTFTATISVPGPGAGTPTGTVQFQIDGSNAGSPVSVASSGGQTTASFTTAALSVAVHTVSAAYSGDASFAASSSAPITQTVNAASTFITLTSAPNPSVYGLLLGFTAVVQSTPPNGGTPTGTVTFQEGTTILGTASLDNTGTAVFTTTTLSAGTHAITAVYSGSANFSPSTSSPLTQTVTTSPIEAFVTALYLKVLERSPDAAGFNFWVQQLQTGATRASVSLAFETSPEHVTLEVDQFYQTFFNRPADAAGQALWVNAILGGESEANVAVAFLTSPEYTAAHPDNTSYVNGLYMDVLGRQQADPSGLAYWVSVLQQGLQTRAQVALSFLSSTEALTQAVNFYYTDLLGRSPTPAELLGFLTALQTGQFTPTAVTTVFLASDEFFVHASAIAGV
jgi:autotransporter-associated beta strand protein